MIFHFTGDNFNRSISVSYSGREEDTSEVIWRKDGETLGTSGTGYVIETDYPADLTATTSLDFTGQFLSRSFGGNYDVIISNNNDVIPESDRTASVSFTISVTGE